MSRFARTIQCGDLVHVISRFVNREFRLTCAAERIEYLRRLGSRLAQSDWRLVSFALMSSHIHLALIAGRERFEALPKSVHSPFARWINIRQERVGPVFADRPTTIITPPVWTARLVAYQHNNPARAAIVTAASDSDWTSHRAYIGRAPCPDWLDVELGLEMMGFGASVAGRQAFNEYVLQRTHNPRDEMLTGNIRAANRELRAGLGVALAVQHPRTGPDGLNYSPRVEARRWDGDLERVIEVAADEMALSHLAVGGSYRGRDVVAARRVAALLAQRLGRPNREIGLRLGISEAAVRRLTRTASPEASATADRLLASIL